nr:GATA zinc finger domain-containing protein 14-like [Procambarus clarkii]
MILLSPLPACRLEDEQREMNHVGGVSSEAAGGELSMGGDVGVTLRCAVYKKSVGVVHELCSAHTVSAALCVQRLSSQRPLTNQCPPSVHRQWVLVTRPTEPSGLDETKASVVGLQQCHHQHHLGHTTCHPQRGWQNTICPPETSPPKHNKNAKTLQRGLRQLDRGRVRTSPRPSLSLAVDESDGQEQSPKDSLPYQIKRNKRNSQRNNSDINLKENLELHKPETTTSQMPLRRMTSTAIPNNLNEMPINTLENSTKISTQIQGERQSNIAFMEEEMQVVNLPMNETFDGQTTDSPPVSDIAVQQSFTDTHNMNIPNNKGETHEGNNLANNSEQNYTDQNEVIVAEKTGTILVEDAHEIVTTVKAAEGLGPMDETWTKETVAVVIEEEEEMNYEQDKETSEGNNTFTVQNHAVFPVFPEFARPNPTPHLNSKEKESENMSFSTVNFGLCNTEKPGDTPKLSSPILPTILSSADSQQQATKAVAENGVGPDKVTEKNPPEINISLTGKENMEENPDMKSKNDGEPNHNMEGKNNTEAKHDMEGKNNTEANHNMDEKHDNEANHNMDEKHDNEAKHDMEGKKSTEAKHDMEGKNSTEVNHNMDEKHDNEAKHDMDEKHDNETKHDMEGKNSTEANHNMNEKHDTEAKHDMEGKNSTEAKHDMEGKNSTEVKHDMEEKHNTDAKHDMESKHDTEAKHNIEEKHNTETKHDGTLTSEQTNLKNQQKVSHEAKNDSKALIRQIFRDIFG